MVGRCYAKTIETDSLSNILRKVYGFLFGTLDLHSHIRYRAVKRYFQDKNRNIEIGAGDGQMIFQFHLDTKKKIVGVSLLKEEVDRALAIRDQLGTKGVTFIQGDLLKLKNIKTNYYGQCLLIDVLEHIGDDRLALRNINKLLVLGGYLIISVPTPNYPKNFGKRYAKTIGHVRDGYFIDDIKALLEDGSFKLIKWRYYTNNLASKLCSFWYGGFLEKIKEDKSYGAVTKQLISSVIFSEKGVVKRALIVKYVLMPLFNFISLFDFLSSSENASSLALLAQKVRSV